MVKIIGISFNVRSAGSIVVALIFFSVGHLFVNFEGGTLKASVTTTSENEETIRSRNNETISFVGGDGVPAPFDSGGDVGTHENQTAATRTTTAEPVAVHGGDQTSTSDQQPVSIFNESSSSSLPTSSPSSASVSISVDVNDNPHNNNNSSSHALPHFMSHIPQSGGTHVFLMVRKLLFPMPEWTSLSLEDRFRPCDEFNKNKDVTKPQEWMQEYGGTRCNFWKSEQPYHASPQHLYTMVRDPREHVVSQYFHCLESRAHRRYANRMPKNLTTWLEAWVDVMLDEETNSTISSTTSEALESVESFLCFDPRNMQSRFLAFQDNDDNNISNVRDSITMLKDMVEDLFQRYDVIGDHAQMDKSACLIVIRYTGWVPQACDCSNTTTTERRLEAGSRRRRLNEERLHHGSTYETTPYQDDLISKLTKSDRRLYNLSRQAFKKQVRLVEEQHKIRVCDRYRTDVPNPTTGNPAEEEQSYSNKQPQDSNEQLSPAPTSTPIVMPHFLSHIPKTAGTYAFHFLGKLLRGTPEWNGRSRKDQFRACLEGKKPLSTFPGRWTKSYRGVRCTLWSSERPYNDDAERFVPQHVYTMTRDPKEHVLSQYFHCLESSDHRGKAHFMPSNLTKWLNAWVKIVENDVPIQVGPGRLDDRFKCYDPRNMQSLFLGFSFDNDNKTSVDAVDDDDDNSTNQAVEDLYRRFDVIGDHAQLEKSVCVIFIRYTGWVPECCNCMGLQQRRLVEKFDHGVKHHGSTFQTTPYQDELLAKLTHSDSLLYNLTRRVFARQVQEVEEQYNIQVCEKFRTDVPNPVTGDPIVAVVADDVAPHTTKDDDDDHKSVQIIKPSELSNVMPHFLSHIPKSGGTYAFRMLRNLLESTSAWKRLSPKDRFQTCEGGKEPLSTFSSGRRWKKSYEGVQCTFWKSERPYDELPNHIYTITRDPKEHVLSQYFHCLESRDHRGKAHFMPSNLTTWLEAWVEIVEKNVAVKVGPGGVDDRFKCYDPRNMQSLFLAFSFDNDDKKLSADGGGDDNNSTLQAMENLYRRYDVIGDFAELDKSVCVIFIRYTGWVPECCNCMGLQQRRLVEKFDHGVKHHGSTFQTTTYQDELLAKLTRSDHSLYNLTRKVFARQVQEVEEQYKIQVCEQFRTDVPNPVTAEPVVVVADVH